MQTMDIGSNLDPAAQDKLQRRLAVQAIVADPLHFGAQSLKSIVYMWGAETSIPDAAFDLSRTSPRAAFGLRVVVQILWVAFVVACCLGRPSFTPERTISQAPILFILLWTRFLFCLLAVIEPAARHHMTVIPRLAGLFLPSYCKLANALRGNIESTKFVQL